MRSLFKLAGRYTASYEKLRNAWGSPKRESFRNAVFGMIALRRGDVQTAGKYLLDLRKGDEIDSLANEMLDSNQHEIVSEFIRRLLKLKLVDFKLNYWRYWLKEVQQGRSPLIGNFRLRLEPAKSKR